MFLRCLTAGFSFSGDFAWNSVLTLLRQARTISGETWKRVRKIVVFHKGKKMKARSGKNFRVKKLSGKNFREKKKS